MTLFFISDSKSTGTGFSFVNFLKKKNGFKGFLLFHTAIWNEGSNCKRPFAIPNNQWVENQNMSIEKKLHPIYDTEQSTEMENTKFCFLTSFNVFLHNSRKCNVWDIILKSGLVQLSTQPLKWFGLESWYKISVISVISVIFVI